MTKENVTVSQHGVERTVQPMMDYVVQNVSLMVVVLDLQLLIVTSVERMRVETRVVFAFVR